MYKSPHVSLCGPVSDEVTYKVQSRCGVFVRELPWVAEADRWICDQLNMSDFPSSSHTETSPAQDDESLHRCDKYIGLIPRRRNNGQKNETKRCVEFLSQALLVILVSFWLLSLYLKGIMRNVAGKP